MITIISYPANTINESIAVPDTLDSEDIIQYVCVDVSVAVDEEYIEVSYNGETITLLITEECRYTPLDVNFINKEGVQQILTFFKKRTDTLSITGEEYESDNGQPINYNHQFERYNVNGRVKFKINSGFVDESLNETFKQLLLSSKVWINENNVLVPVNINSKSLQFKTRQNDRLINYEIGIDYAFNEINNI